MEPLSECWRTSHAEMMSAISNYIAGVYLRLQSCPLKAWAMQETKLFNTTQHNLA